ncbi:hypothetical protein RRG08_002626 [Elysia crispata]|uniref:Uncharacterized protein n=1 Tax=Elysia crispata TaxID=231223 RepID=A0AAE1CT70_9GAST|nr:hypothetical protein RRG08_002626 [Elysia crispata]
MSRRASLLAKQEKRKPRVRFPDELVFLDNIKGNDIQACHSMLRRASVQLDLNGLDTSGLTPLHNAVLEGNLGAVELLVQHGADINRQDADTWTPLHAACANGEADIARYLLSRGASKDIKTADGERPLDLCDARDFSVISVMLESDTARRARMLSAPDEDDEDDEDEHSSTDPEDDQEEKNSSSNATTRGNKGNISCSGSSPEFHSSQKTKTDDTSSLTKDMNKLKTASESSNTNPRNLFASQSSPKALHKSPTSSPNTQRAKRLAEGSSPSRKSPTASPKLNNIPLRTSPGSPRKSPNHSPGALRKSQADKNGNTGSSTSQTIGLSRTSRGSNRGDSGNGNSTRQQLTTSKTSAQPGHSILKKSNSNHCHAVAE